MHKLHRTLPTLEADERLAGRVISSTVLQNPVASSFPHITEFISQAHSTVL